MNTIEEVKAELTRRGIKFPGNMGEEKLRSKLAEAETVDPGGVKAVAALQADADAKAAEEVKAAEAAAGNSRGAVQGAAPAAAIAPSAASPAAAVPKPAERYYDGLRQSKVDAGLPLADAIEVTVRQRAEDEAAGVKPWETATEESA